MDREAIEEAIEVLEDAGAEMLGETGNENYYGEAITALRKALETEQEPVAWITDGGKGELWWYQSSKFDEEGNLIGPNPDDIPLYTAPPKQWVGLTEEEREFLLHQALRFYDTNAQLLSFIKTVEEKLKEKNA
jgi:hypothetical protein